MLFGKDNLRPICYWHLNCRFLRGLGFLPPARGQSMLNNKKNVRTAIICVGPTNGEFFMMEEIAKSSEDVDWVTETVVFGYEYACLLCKLKCVMCVIFCMCSCLCRPRVHMCIYCLSPPTF